ncbi:FAD-dependent monooxygenase [Streptosporangium sp. 'caverna']|uniref:FAD-dependent monooxygenase n=1 Tax=Streptosporangium sp. 'caverna' TaxID=2202249 RepID=UPI000D7D558C|nr:FAD-dependent monooxygenase [Streptosporangium sp. 'caverna']AWS44261.1 FAD-dependent monooxygenase [Streptosporangium sp. 'caverna']
MKIIIIGIGVGGLAAARYLLAAGHEVEIYEQAERLRTEGASLILWSNGTGILRDLGLEPEALGSRMDAMNTLSEDGHTLLKLNLNRLARRFGHPTVVVPRGDLLLELAKGLPASVLNYGKRCVAINEPLEGYSGPLVAEFADGTKAEGDIVIGADGHRSAVRRHLHGDTPATYTGLATWHGLTRLPVELPQETTGLVFHGKAGFATMFAAGNGQIQWVFVTPWAEGDTVPRGVRDERTGDLGVDAGTSAAGNLRERFGHLVSPVPELLEQLTDEEIGLFPHILHSVPDKIGQGRITLIGDALHAIPPTLAQGVNQTLEDAWCLNQVLAGSGRPAGFEELAGSDTKAIEQRLRLYESMRVKRLQRLHGMAKFSENRPTPSPVLRFTPWLVPHTSMTGWAVKTYSNFLA